jgi:N-acetylglutamate synthase-like GNAT family acetyltransferase
MAYAKEHGFEEVYVVSSHINLYEKYGFVQIDEKQDVWGNAEKIYVRAT